MWIITNAFYLFIWISVTQEEYFVSDTSSGWSDVIDGKCTFAKPPLIFSEEKVTTQLNGFNTANDNVWVGYFRQSSGFEYIGCVKETDIKRNVAPKRASKDPGYCFTICSFRGTSGIIGIFNTTCFCLQEKDILQINLKRSRCTIECTSGTKVACGGVHHDTNYFSLYTLNYNVTDKVNKAGSGRCLLLNPVNHNFEWKNCGTWFSVFCANDQNDLKVLGNNHWIGASVDCFSKKSVQANFTSSKAAVIDTTALLWTGVIRSHVIYDFDAVVPSLSDIEYGYLTKSDSAYELKFERNDTQKQFLCVRGASTAKTTNTISTSLTVNDATVVTSTELTKNQTPTSSVFVSGTTITTHTNNTSTAKTTNTVPTSLAVNITSVVSSTIISKSQAPISSTVTSHTDNNSTVNHVMEQTHMKDSSVTMPVVVSVSVVLIVAISITAFVVLRRRGKIPDICGNTNSTKSTSVQTKYESSVKQITESNQYEQVDDMISNSKIDRNTDVETDNTNYAHTYFVLENVEKQPEYEDAPGKHAKMEGSNVYNTLEQELDKKRKQSKTIDNTYDTTKTVAEKLKSKLGEDSDAFGDTDENLYNHTNSVQMKNNKPENVYNVTGDIENAYGDADTKHENKAHGDDDTYNHI